MGGRRGFYIHSDTWFGGQTSVFTQGFAPYAAKMAFKQMYFRTGGKPATWGMPASQYVLDKVRLP
jgi:sulfide:quinone oxidoreductase